MNIQWNSNDYTDNFNFVYKYGEDVLALIDAPEGSLAVDLGCGNGALAKKLADRGYKVIGIDASDDMLEKAAQTNPDITFIRGDATNFTLDKKADVIFSNAVFHWIDADKQEQLIKNIASNLKQGGQLVFEFGGKGCAEAVHSALEKIFAQKGLEYQRAFYFPTIGEYAPILEKYGFKVEFAVLFDRPTIQQSENGLADWIKMFDKKPFEGLKPDLCDEIISSAENTLKPKLFVDGKWVVDYVRIRMKAKKIF